MTQSMGYINLGQSIKLFSLTLDTERKSLGFENHEKIEMSYIIAIL